MSGAVGVACIDERNVKWQEGGVMTQRSIAYVDVRFAVVVACRRYGGGVRGI